VSSELTGVKNCHKISLAISGTGVFSGLQLAKNEYRELVTFHIRIA
jgi:hypothetical protein